MAHGDVRAPLCQGDLDTCRTPRDEGCQSPLSDAEETLVYVGRVDLALDDVQDRDVTALLPRHRGHHAVLGLQQPPHDIQHRRLADRLRLLDLVASKGCVRRHEEVAPRSWDQGGQDADEIVVHVSRIPEGRRASRHDCRYELVRLLERRLLDMEPIRRYM